MNFSSDIVSSCVRSISEQPSKPKREMIKTQLATDRFAIGMSLACAIHCLFMPSFFVVSSSFFSVSFNSELIHYFILLMAVPISVFALHLGMKNHKSPRLFAVGAIGLITLILAALIGESALGELGETSLTVSGSILVIFAHFRNYQICRQIECTSCENC